MPREKVGGFVEEKLREVGGTVLAHGKKSSTMHQRNIKITEVNYGEVIFSVVSAL